MDIKKTTGFSKFEVLLGLAVVAIAAVAVPWLGGELQLAKQAGARAEAGHIAQAVLDYHSEMGRWPAPPGQAIDLARLTHPRAAQATFGSLAPAAQPLLAEVRVDAWGRPYTAVVFDARATGAPRPAPTSQPGRTARRHLPSRPPEGVTIVVLSAGPDGKLETPPHLAARASVPVFGGDDTGFVLR